MNNRLNSLLVGAVALSLAACDGTPATSSSSVAALSSVAVVSSAPLSSSSIAVSSSSVAPVASSSSVNSQVSSFILQEGGVGFCSADYSAKTGGVTTEHAGFTGPGFVDVENVAGAKIIWQVNATESNIYSVTFRYANAGTAPRSGLLTANGNTGAGVSFNLGVTGAWTTWAEETVEIALNAGANTLTLAATGAEGLANIDSMTLSGPGISAGECAAASSSAPSSSGSTSSASTEPVTKQATIIAAYKEGFGASATGGQGGQEVTVRTGLEIYQAICGRSSVSTPIILKIAGTINRSNTSDPNISKCQYKDDQILLKSDQGTLENISFIGVGDSAVFDGVGLKLNKGVNNVIIQNVTIKGVNTQDGDGILLDEDVTNIWIDHNTIIGGQKESGFDSLIDIKKGSANITVSYNLLEYTNRVGLIGFNDSDVTNNITFHHNWYMDMLQRIPLIRKATVHIYNNYYKNPVYDQMYHGINVRADGRALIEGNYFYNINDPIIASDDSPVPGCWTTGENTVLPFIYYKASVGNGALAVPDIVDGQLMSTCSSKVTVPYSYKLDHSSDVPAKVMANAGAGKLDKVGQTVTVTY